MKRSIGFLALCAGLVAGAAGHAKEIKGFDANAGRPAQAARPEMAQAAARLGGAIASVDERTGTPSFLWATGPAHKAPATMAARPATAAMHHLSRLAPAYRLSPGALSTAEVARVHDVGRGAVIVTLRQRIDGAEVYRSEAKVIMRQDLSLVAISGNLHPDGTPQGKAGSRAFTVAAPAALAAAMQDLYGIGAADAIQELSRDQGGYLRFGLEAKGAVAAAGLGFVEPARAKKVFFPVGDRLVPAWFVEVYAGKQSAVESDYVRYVIAADNGRVLYRENLTADVAFNYRVWADPAGDLRPLDGPIADYTPHPTGTPDGTDPAYVAPVLVSMEGFNTNPSGVADPWLGSTAVESRGNNVDAYADHNAPDGYTNGDIRATTTAAQTFDRVYDVNLQPVSSADQIMAATTQLFFVNNWLHDYFYDSGFNEEAANAQQSNYGRGGLGGDVLRAEAQDGAFAGNRNNANMSTPADGVSPRMQMYLWNSNDTRSLTIQPTGATPATGTAGFGPSDYNVTAPLVVVNDGVGTATDGCTLPFVNAAEIAGKIVVIDRGSCSFKLKTSNAQANGAVGVIIANNQVGAPPMTMGNDAAVPAVSIPAMSVSFEEGGSLKTQLGGGAALTGTMYRQAGIERDGTIDNAIVAHEWGHYFHHRLSECGTKTCGALSEGWADFIAAHMVMREGDDLDGTFALAIYSTKVFGDSGYYGIRRSPYSTNQAVNGFTFRHIQRGEALPAQPIQPLAADNDEVHNAGEIWTQMLFEAYRNLLVQTQGPNPPYSFEEARRRMADYITGGLKGAPVDATYTETRDAILAAAYAADPADATLLAEGFATRGAGSCAESPSRFSDDLVGVVESFALNPKIDITSATIDDSVLSCDEDGLLDGEERGKVRVQVRNPSVAPLVGAQLTVATTTAGVSFPAGATMTLPDVEPFGVVDVDLDVELDASFTQRTILDLSVTVANAEACVTEVIRAETPAIHMDDVPASSASDTVESANVAWMAGSATTGLDGSIIWSRSKVDVDNHVWYGLDLGSTSDTWIESPDLLVSATDPLVVSFEHYYNFEDDSTPTYWDGGVIEIGEVINGSVSWQDISNYVDPGYGGALTNLSGNPLADRMAFVGQNASFPLPDTLSLDLGTAFAGKAVRIRFRIGTDSSVGDIGWGIDNLTFEGITNTPFGSVVDDTGACNIAPVANAGLDQTVEGGRQVLLDASASSDPDMDPLTFAWQQTAGDQVTVFTNGALATFTAPDVTQEVTLTFEVAVSDGEASATDTVNIVVVPPSQGTGGNGGGGTGSGGEGGDGLPPTSDDQTTPEGGGCGCVVAGDDAGTDGTRNASLGALAALGMILARRRRRARA